MGLLAGSYRRIATCQDCFEQFISSNLAPCFCRPDERHAESGGLLGLSHLVLHRGEIRSARSVGRRSVIRGAKGNLLGYSLAVTSTTSLAVLSGTTPDIQETRELYRSTSFQFVRANEIYSVDAGIVSKLDKEQIEPDRRLLSRIGS
jgi:hypothetical protein